MFVLPVGQVREIFEFTHMTRIPQTPDCMRGVINLDRYAYRVRPSRRGGDFRHQYHYCVCTDRGIAVQERALILNSLHGMAKVEEHFAMILDINKVFFSGELSFLQQSSS